MIEAVDWRDHAALLLDAGRAAATRRAVALQAIVIDDRSYERAKRNTDFIKAVHLPRRLPAVGRARSSARLATPACRPVDVHRIGHHYPETLRRWQANLDAQPERDPATGVRRALPADVALLPAVLHRRLRSPHIDGVHVVLDKG